MAKPRRKRATRYSREWPASHKRYAKRTAKSTDDTGNTAARNLDNHAPQRHTMTHKAVTSLVHRATNSKHRQPSWVHTLVANAQEWLTRNTHLDSFAITTLTKQQLAHLDSIHAKRT